jgi:MarR family transcriptional regulator, organic hydroperoxide resistance regulator
LKLNYLQPGRVVNKVSNANSRKPHRGKGAETVRVPAPVTTADRIILEIRKFIAAAIFFNAQAADQVGLGLTDMQMVHMLQLHGPATPKQLGLWTGLSSGGVTVALDRLEEAGYLRREPNPDDRRSLLVALVPARIRKLTSLYEGVEKVTRHGLRKLPEQDLKAVVRFFETLEAVRKNNRSMLTTQP